jgi:4-hydroxy-tetrahydrodipicolinate synthase
MNSDSLFGISAAVATPFDSQGEIDLQRLADHSKRLLTEGCSSLTYFGTTGEGPSISTAERHATLRAMVEAGIPGGKINVAVIVPALGDAIAEAKVGIEIGCNALLVAPPFYFKGQQDDGIFEWFSQLLNALGDACPKIILYHIPQVTAAPLSIDLIRRLKQAFPKQVYGVKDSSGDWENGRQLLEMKDLAIMLGDERLLGKASRLGGQGMISGVANFQAQSLARTLSTGNADPALNALVDTIVSHPVIPAVKIALAHYLGDEAWTRVRAPLLNLDTKQANDIVAGLNALQTKEAS